MPQTGIFCSPREVLKALLLCSLAQTHLPWVVTPQVPGVLLTTAVMGTGLGFLLPGFLSTMPCPTGRRGKGKGKTKGRRQEALEEEGLRKCGLLLEGRTERARAVQPREEKAQGHCPKRLWSLHPWSYSKPKGTPVWAARGSGIPRNEEGGPLPRSGDAGSGRRGRGEG